MEFGRIELRPLCKLDSEEYRKREVRDVWKKNGLATLGHCLIAGAITIAMMILAVSESMRMLAGLFYGGTLLIGAGAYIFLWRCAIKNVKNKKYDAVYEGLAQVIVAYPVTVRYLRPDGSEGVSQVDLENQKAILAGRFVKVVMEDERVVEIKDEVVI